MITSPKLASPHGGKRIIPQKRFDLDQQFLWAMAGLVTMWANAESWLHRALAVLLRTDPHRAALICASFTSTRAKMELVEHMAIMCLPTARRGEHLQKILSEFKAVTTLRNRLCHSPYMLDPSKSIITDIFNRTFQHPNFDGTNFNEHRPIDLGFVNEIRQAHRQAVKLCGKLERFVKNAPRVVLERPRSTPLPLRKNRKTKDRRARPGSAPKQKQQRRPLRA